MGDRRDEGSTRTRHEEGMATWLATPPNRDATPALLLVLIGAIEDLTAAVAADRLIEVETFQDQMPMQTTVKLDVDPEPEPLTAEQSIPQTDAIMEMLRRKQALSAIEKKARVSTENPPQADPEKGDG